MMYIYIYIYIYIRYDIGTRRVKGLEGELMELMV
jgi:hypothetical protein